MNRPIRSAAVLAAAALTALFVPITSATGQSVESFAFATGTVLHADLLRSGETRLVDAEVAFSGAIFDTEGLDAAVLNELDREFAPQLPTKSAFGRATGLEAGLGVAPDVENQLILSGRAEVAAPPNVAGVSREIGPVDLDPLAWADLLRGEAFARTGDPPCGPIDDISRGLAYVTDVQLLDTASSGVGDGLESPVVALNASDPARAVSQSHSRTAFVAQIDRNGRSLGDDLGIMSEVRETIAPVTLFGGTDNALTIEFLGEWVLRATATGMHGGAFVHYGPGEVSPQTPVLRLIDADGVENLITLQELLGDDGLVVNIPGVAEVAIGEPPRAIDGAAGSSPTESSDGTRASAAVDVVRVRALPGTPAELADIRVGHMEVSSQVPVGGVRCPAPAVPTPEVEVRAEFSDLPKTGAVAAATVVAGLLLAAGALALRRRLR
jgi:LPXTG-motif cell wall-anchored protein